jgi:hypothetical protein
MLPASVAAKRAALAAAASGIAAHSGGASTKG